jgi:mono/diheme cytochrome c family protein
MRIEVVLLSAALGLAVAGTAAAQQPVDAAALYTRTCASCHGPHGTPNPAMARAMAGIPDFAAASMASVPDTALRDAILNGKGRMMASYKARLSPEEVTALVRYIKSLSHH